MLLKNETYDILKLLSTKVIPAIVFLVGSIGHAVNWSYTAIAVAIIGAVGEAIGILIGESSKAYYGELGNEG